MALFPIMVSSATIASLLLGVSVKPAKHTAKTAKEASKVASTVRWENTEEMEGIVYDAIDSFGNEKRLLLSPCCTASYTNRVSISGSIWVPSKRLATCTCVVVAER